ncbi:MAG: ATP-binding protein [Anaerolineales bacterium]
MQDKFVGRQQEIELLNRLWDTEPKAQLMILYGRRRVGKTRLLSEWKSRRGKRTLMWVADQDSKDAHLRQFSQMVYGFERPDRQIPADFTYASWDQALQEVADLASSSRLAVFMDEFTYLLASDPTLAGKLQNLWDQRLGDSNLFLCLSGSHLGMMERGALAYQAPLYGRATAKLNLLPLGFGQTRNYFPNYTAAERVALYAIFGGIPQYWGLINQNQSIPANIKNLLLSRGNPMDGEARLLLYDFLSDLHNYVAILRAMANRRNTIKEISGFTGIRDVHLTAYLSNLAETGYVTRFEPIMAQRPTRSGRHHITDPYLRFYFRFLASRHTQIALGETDQAYAEIKRHLVDFTGTHTWEEICQEWVLRASNREILPVYPDQVGRDWSRNHQVDVVGVNRMNGHLVLGECKWENKPTEVNALRGLVEKRAKYVIPKERKWQVYFMGFSRKGFSEEAAAYANEVNRNPLSGKNWRSVGMRLIDLEQVDKDLSLWSG